MNADKTLRAASPGAVAVTEPHNVAYIKRVVIEGEAVYAIHTGDGTHIGWAPDRDLAFAALRQQDMEPVSVH